LPSTPIVPTAAPVPVVNPRTMSPVSVPPGSTSRPTRPVPEARGPSRSPSEFCVGPGEIFQQVDRAGCGVAARDARQNPNANRVVGVGYGDGASIGELVVAVDRDAGAVRGRKGDRPRRRDRHIRGAPLLAVPVVTGVVVAVEIVTWAKAGRLNTNGAAAPSSRRTLNVMRAVNS